MALRPDGLLEYDLSTFGASRLVFWQCICCALAVVMNLSTYSLLDKVSNVTYQVLGQVKGCIIVMLGLLFFDAAPPSGGWLVLRFLGLAVAYCGACSYSILKTREASAEKDKAK